MKPRTARIRLAFLTALAVAAGALLAPPTLFAQSLPCKPCAGLRTTDPAAILAALRRGPAPADGELLVVAWTVELDGSASTEPAQELEETGVTPLLTLRFQTPAPLLDHLSSLTQELEAAARLVRQAPRGAWFQIGWEPGEEPTATEAASEYAFLIKRAAVAITGAAAAEGTKVLSRPLPADPEELAALYGQEVAAYLDAVALEPAPPEDLATATEALAQLDPGKPVVTDASPLPEAAPRALAEAARQAREGVSLTLFTAADAGREVLPSLVVLARDFAGDLAFDPYSTPGGPAGTEAWAFVRGEDLGLRVIAVPSTAERQDGELRLTFSDAQLQRPARVPLDGSEAIPLAAASRCGCGYELRVADPGEVTVLRLERPSLAEMAGEGGLTEELTVASERQIPVEEILRRLQAREDAQSRRVSHYQAFNRTTLRFQFGTGTQTLEVTYEGPFFFRPGEGFDWAWERFYVNGVKWRGKRIPEIPLIRPEKAAALPLEITFTPEYRYRLRGTAVVDGRQCWVVDFRPAELIEGQSLFQGTVWVDRELYVRVRTRAVQLGLTGDVISNEETTEFSPVDEEGRPADWTADALYFGLHTTGQEIFSILNATTVVEKETWLTELSINEPDFEPRRREVMASEVTMVRDTEKGLRYLVQDKDSGERVVEMEPDTSRLFLAGGVFFDDSVDYPIPLAGVNYFNFDWRDSGTQINALFAGPLATVDIADPEWFGSRWDAGADLFALGVRTTDDQFRGGVEVPEEAVEQRVADLDLNLGRPIGSFVKVSFSLGLRYVDFAAGDDTSPAFVVPEDHLDRSLALSVRYSRSGWRAAVDGSAHSRSDWKPWGLPDAAGELPEFDPQTEDYVRWGASVGKNWYLPNFRKVGLELEYVDGRDLDRFSKYEFGFFSDVRVHGYQSGRVRAERAYAAHATYGFELGETLRIDGVVDGAWATDEASGLDNELLAGVGLSGTVVGPWRTLVNLDIGTPVAGPDNGISVFLVFLKLFR